MCSAKISSEKGTEWAAWYYSIYLLTEENILFFSLFCLSVFQHFIFDIISAKGEN